MRALPLLLVLLAAPALADPAAVEAVGAWVRATPPGQHVSVAYVTLTSPVADRLVGVSTPLAHASVHTVTMQGGVMRMRLAPSLALPAGTPVALAPGGTHIMLTHLKAPLAVGGTVPLTLRFAHAAPETIEARVLPIGATGP